MICGTSFSLTKNIFRTLPKRKAGNVPGDENYQRHPDKKLERMLAAYGWEQVGDDLWWKGSSRLYVDAVGVFLYRIEIGFGVIWRRTHGLSHNLIPHRARRITFKDMSTLDLLTGEWNGQAKS